MGVKKRGLPFLYAIREGSVRNPNRTPVVAFCVSASCRCCAFRCQRYRLAVSRIRRQSPLRYMHASIVSVSFLMAYFFSLIYKSETNVIVSAVSSCCVCLFALVLQTRKQFHPFDVLIVFCFFAVSWDDI